MCPVLFLRLSVKSNNKILHLVTFLPILCRRDFYVHTNVDMYIEKFRELNFYLHIMYLFQENCVNLNCVRLYVCALINRYH